MTARYVPLPSSDRPSRPTSILGNIRDGFITQAIRAGKAERRVKEHSGHALCETLNDHSAQKWYSCMESDGEPSALAGNGIDAYLLVGTFHATPDRFQLNALVFLSLNQGRGCRGPIRGVGAGSQRRGIGLVLAFREPLFSSIQDDRSPRDN
jgi:hypothetical protein